MRSRFALVALVVLAGCGGDTQETSEPPDVDPCADGVEVALPDGSCLRPGMLPDTCLAGFVHDGVDRCLPVLPAEICPPGTMAVPGDEACRAVAECGDGRWGNIPVDASTVFVDQAYGGGLNDGTEDRPYVSVLEAVLAAPPGALVAVAEGTYVENVVINAKPVRIHGVCPAKVTIQSVDQITGTCLGASLCFLTGASGSEAHGLALTGGGRGVMLSGASDVVLDALWVHDTGKRGVTAQDNFGPTSFFLRGSLVEAATDVAVFGGGAHMAVEASVVRGTRPVAATQSGGRGISTNRICLPVDGGFDCDPAPSLLVQGSVIELNHELGVMVSGAVATFEGSVVRATQADAATQTVGRGIGFEGFCAAGLEGAICDPAYAAVGTIRGTYVDANHDVGVHVAGAEVTIEGSVVRGTIAQPANQLGGRGLSLQVPCIPSANGSICDDTAPARVTLRRTVVEDNVEFGMYVSASVVAVEDSIVRRTMPSPDGTKGRGINAQHSCVLTNDGQSCNLAARSSLTLTGSAVDANHDVGVFVAISDLTMQRSVVRSTLPMASSGLYGDGVTVYAEGGAASAAILSSIVSDSTRAGVSVFGATASLQDTVARCSTIDLAGEATSFAEFVVQDEGGNACGCPEVADSCKVLSSGLEPPEPIFQ